jgi:hypothetical protein
VDWKKISRKLVEDHGIKGSSIVMLDPHSIEGEVVNLSTDDFCLEFEGKELSAKKVRKFLWEHRNKKALSRKHGIIWSAYLEKEDKSIVGVGAITDPKVAKRMEGN